MRRALGLDDQRREAAEGVAQGLGDGLGSVDSRGVYGEPASLGIDPRAGDSPARERARAQFVGYASAQVAHLLASDRKALLPGLYFRALLRDLPDDRPRQQFLIVAQRDHVLLIDGVQQAAAARDRYPATARHLERRAGLQSAVRKPTFEVRGSRCPFCGQTMKNQILEQHERHPRKESADYIERAPEFSFIFSLGPRIRSETLIRKGVHCMIPKAVFVQLAQH